MLPARVRLRDTRDFQTTFRHGVRVARKTLVIHAVSDIPDAHSSTAVSPTRVGFVVSKRVGCAVVRNRVKRQLRHLVAAQLAHTPSGLRIVVRALPSAATSNNELAPDLCDAWESMLTKLEVAA